MLFFLSNTEKKKKEKCCI